MSLTKDVAAPQLNDTVTFTCEGMNFSIVPGPVAYFRHKVGTAEYIEDPTAYPINMSYATMNNKASKQMVINQSGIWTVQCRVCWSSSKTYCTEWGKANISQQPGVPGDLRWNR
ncbi:MAG: hypothetical protein V1810_01205 [Candidatus Beckwithbacteria bacterium]